MARHQNASRQRCVSGRPTASSRFRRSSRLLIFKKAKSSDVPGSEKAATLRSPPSRRRVDHRSSPGGGAPGCTDERNRSISSTRQASWRSCAICSGMCGERSSWSGTAAAATKATDPGAALAISPAAPRTPAGLRPRPEPGGVNPKPPGVRPDGQLRAPARAAPRRGRDRAPGRGPLRTRAHQVALGRLETPVSPIRHSLAEGQ